MSDKSAAQPQSEAVQPPRVTVAICTFRRPDQLAELLLRLDRQVFTGAAPSLDVVVVDNSPDAEAAPVVERLAPTVGYPVRLVPLGAGNISTARNRGLSEIAPDARFAVWIDDDERPADGWLDALLVAHSATGADFVIGPVDGDVPAGAPAWLRRGRFYDALEQLPDLAPLREGITGNALADLAPDAALRRLGLRFDETLGAAGGEDQLFFRTALAGGARLRFAAGATVHEDVPPDRLTFRYLTRREYRKGNTLGILDRPLGTRRSEDTATPQAPHRPVRRLAAAAWWATSGVAGSIPALAARDRARLAHAVLRAVRAAGMLTGLAGKRFDHYATPAPSPTAPRLEAAHRAVIVVTEDPAFQEAGHTRYLRSWIRHLESQNFEVVLALTGSRSASLIHRDGDGVRLVAPGTVRLGPYTVMLEPRRVAQTVAWRLLRRMPPERQAVLQGARDRWRSGRGVDHKLGAPLDEVTRGWLASTLDELAPTVVVFDSVFNVLRNQALPPSVRATYVITHDVVWQRAEAFRQRGYRITPPDFGRADEAELLGGAATPVAITDRDALTFREMLPGKEVLVVPASAAPVRSERRQIAGRLLFIGSASLHNVDGIKWFLTDVWPLVRATQPQATLHIAGSVCGRLAGEFGADPAADGVTLCGELPSLEPEYGDAALVVVPLLAGSGMKVKTVEALAYGRPVASTTVGVQGLEHLTPSPFVVADDPRQLADCITELFADPARLAALTEAAVQAAQSLGPAQAFRAFDRHVTGAIG